MLNVFAGADKRVVLVEATKPLVGPAQGLLSRLSAQILSIDDKKQ